MAPGDGWDAKKMFDLYLHDYMVKRGMHETAAIFRNEADVYTNPVAIDSPEGFLCEWWSLLHDVIDSRQQKHQEAKEKAPIKTEPMTLDELQISRPVVPQWALNQQRPGQFGFDYDNMLGKQACLVPARMFEEEQFLRHPLRNFDSNLNLLDVYKWNLSKSAGPSSSHMQQQICNQAQQIVARGNRNDNRIGRAMPRDSTLYGVQKRTLPITIPGGSVVRGVNSAPQDGCLYKYNPYIQAPHNLQLFPPLTEHSQQKIFGQALQNLTSTSSRSSTNIDGRTLILPKRSLNIKDAQMKQTEECRCQYEQHLQQQLQDIDRKRKRLSCTRTGNRTLDCANVEVDKPVDVNVELFLSPDAGIADNKGTALGTLKRIPTASSSSTIDHNGFSFEEVACLSSSKSKVVCCHFSTDGKMLASAGHEKKVFIWNTETFEFTKSSDGHSLITDVRFRPNSTLFATSSFDRNVQIWDASKPSKPLFKLLGHTNQVMSLDFHPRKVDLLCSCDDNDVIRLWNVNNCAWIRVSKGGAKQIRFQPQCGKLLAAATGNSINVMDFELDSIQFKLKGHAKEVLSICWDASGNYIASVSEDSARVWSLESGGKCIHELLSNGNKFQSCTFHPVYSLLLIIGGYQTLEFWNPVEGNKTWSVPAHNGLIAALANSPKTEMIASASHDHCVKLWE